MASTKAVSGSTNTAPWIVAASGLWALMLLASAVHAQGPGSTGSSSIGATTPGQAQGAESALQQLSAPTGQNLAAPTQDSFKGSLVTGKATDGVLDLSLDDAIQRGLRTNLGLILQTKAQQNAHGHGQCLH